MFCPVLPASRGVGMERRESAEGIVGFSTELKARKCNMCLELEFA